MLKKKKKRDEKERARKEDREVWNRGDLRGKETGNDGRKKTGGVMRVKQREPG
jgi:hypothetical protein